VENTVDPDDSAGCAWLLLGMLVYLAVSIGGYFLIKLLIDAYAVTV
jgi:hypothetical protein